MGRLLEGRWTTETWRSDDKGRFLRDSTSFRSRVTADGSSGFPAEAGRYHLYVSYACPWAHRTLIARSLYGLEAAISVSVVDPFMGDDGWFFSDGPGCVRDAVNGADFLWQIYAKADPRYTGRVTVPVLWDKQQGKLVNNESREIVRMFGEGLAGLGDGKRELCPAALRGEIDQTIDAIYAPVNNGVYRAGFAASQEAYDEAVVEVFAALDHWDEVLGHRRFLCGDVLTEADVFLFTTLLRFDPVYHGHFKCNLRRVVDYENLWGFVRDVYQTPGVAETCRLDHIKQHYYRSHVHINPTRIVPRGPILDHRAPHGRDRRYA
jgi:glutathionyl-hydroquinone reductase